MEGGWDREGVNICRNDEEVSSSTEWTERGEHPPGSGGARSTGRRVATSMERRFTVLREGVWGRRGVILQGVEVARSTGREGGTERGSTSAELRCAVHMEGGWDREG